MSFTQKTWKDRISEYPTRRTLTNTSTSDVSTVTVAREEGTISQQGDAFSATNMNDLETRISNGFSTLSNDSVVLSSTNTTPDSIKFGKDSSNNYGYIIPGADTVTPFKSSIYECIFNSNSIHSNTNIETWYNGIIDVGDSYNLGNALCTHITITISNINEYIYYQGFENNGAGHGHNFTPQKITGLSLNSTIVNSSSTQILKYKITDINNISLDLVNTGYNGWYIFTFLI